MLAPLAALLLTLQADAQRAPLSAEEAAKMEAALTASPRQNSVRAALLEYYFRAPVDPAAAIPARRRHILWIIENAPDADIAYGPLVSIDASGHALADPQGFQLASAAWRAQTSKPDVKAMTLANAAYFFKLADRTLALDLLKRALHLDPESKEIAARMGDEYALLILGVTAINGSGMPLQADAALAQSDLARQARDELTVSSNPHVLAKGGYQLLWQGGVLSASRKLTFDPDPLALAALDRAVSLAPGDAGVAALRAQYDKIQSAKSGHPAPPASEAPPAPPPPAGPPPPMNAALFGKIAVGMTREEVLRLATPATRISMQDDDGRILEIFEYAANGARIGSVHLTDGVVSSVQVR